jgi:hypothetical protein
MIPIEEEEEQEQEETSLLHGGCRSRYALGPSVFM